jgi:Protein of unknown function (DUF2568)
MRVSAFTAVNLGLAFALELAAFGASGYGAFNLVNNTALGALLAAGTLLTITVLWGVFAAPRAPFCHPPVSILLKALVFAGAVIALVLNGHLVLGMSMGAAAIINASLLRTLRDSATVPPASVLGKGGESSFELPAVDIGERDHAISRAAADPVRLPTGDEDCAGRNGAHGTHAAAATVPQRRKHPRVRQGA